MRLCNLISLSILAVCVHCLSPTDEIQDADIAQSGYLDNHNLHPATVGSSIFGILWKNKYASNELWFARPLVYTPPGSRQIVFLASAQNVLRTLDAVNGTLLKSRTLQPPFLASELSCYDVAPTIGVIGTPIIDPTTNTVYFFSKGYIGGAASGGVLNGRYWFYAVDVLKLQDRPGFPVLIDGHYADNDVGKYFVGGTVLQRPSVVLINGVVIGAFGGHCDHFNYTGMLVAVSTTPGVGVTSIFAMESTPGPIQLNYMTETGGKAGIWQSGMGISVDVNSSRIFIATGNGQGHQNGDVSASGRTPLSTLDEVIGAFTISTSGVISLFDYFEPFSYIAMDNGDRDLGSSGVTLLDPGTFHAGAITRMAVTAGKNSILYIVNANNLGGFKQGPGGADNVVQEVSLPAPVFGGIGSYPLEGGYIYWTPIGFPTVAYKMGFDSNGGPLFSPAGASATNGAGRTGIGIPTITTFKGQAGTGIVWVADPTSGLLAFNAVPVNNVLVPLTLPATGGLNKFIRPAFGDGRVYVSDMNGNVICLGSPVALPLQCTQPVDFGGVNIGSSATKTITCTTLIALTSIKGCISGDVNWKCSNSTLPTGPLAKGATFSFPVTWDLTTSTIQDTPNTSYGKVQPGVVSTSLDIYTVNAVAQYSTVYPISLTGTEVSPAAFLALSPGEVAFGGFVLGSSGTATTLTKSVVISNLGSQDLIITGIAWTTNVDTSKGPFPYTNISTPNADLGNGFTSSSFPAVGSTIAAGQSITIPLAFTTSSVGSYTTFVEFWTTGGSNYVLMSASAATAPVANISVSLPGGEYSFAEPVVMDFGNVLAGTVQNGNIRICNSGGSALSITKSKPPEGIEIYAPNSAVDLHEGQYVDTGTCALGQVTVNAAPLGVNRPNHTDTGLWVLNTDDLTFGVHNVQVTANIVSRQVGPLLPNGFAAFQYLGCYYDGAGRVLSKSTTNQVTTENGMCQTQCSAQGYIFAGTEYHIECWCGNTAPSYTKFSNETLRQCQMSCVGDTSQVCGGAATYISVYYDSRKYTPGPDSIPGLPPSSSVPPAQSSPPVSSKPSSTPVASSKPATTSSSLSSSSSVSSSTNVVIVSSVPPSTTSSILSSSAASTTSSPTSSSSRSSTSALSSTSSSSSSITSFTSTSSTSPTTSTFSTMTSTSSIKVSTSSTKTSSSSTASVVPTTVPSVGNYSYVGCYTEGTPHRALNAKSFANDSMTVEACYSFCSPSSYIWFGVEWHRECYCGNTPTNGSVLSTSGANCTMECHGDPSELCGGSRRLSMYSSAPAVLGAGVAVPTARRKRQT